MLSLCSSGPSQPPTSIAKQPFFASLSHIPLLKKVDAFSRRASGMPLPELRWLFSRIGDLGSVELREWRQRMKSRAGRACDFAHFDSSYQQCICNQGTVTAPGYSLRAHDRDPLLPCKLYQRVQALSEFRSLHVIGIAAEARVVPTHIHRVMLRMSEAAQARHIAVMDAGGMQRGGQLVAIELRIMS